MSEFFNPVIGVDPGYARLGLAVLMRRPDQVWRALEVSTVKTSPRREFHARCGEIQDALEHAVLLALLNCKLALPVLACESQVALEGARQRKETNYEAVLVQQIVGIVRSVALRNRLQFVEVPVAAAKAVFRGIPRTATKAQVARAVRAVVKNCPDDMSEHASDAVAIALAGARMAR